MHFFWDAQLGISVRHFLHEEKKGYALLAGTSSNTNGTIESLSSQTDRPDGLFFPPSDFDSFEI